MPIADRRLTVDWAVWMAFVWSALGIIVAVIIWYGITSPLAKKRGSKT